MRAVQRRDTRHLKKACPDACGEGGGTHGKGVRVVSGLAGLVARSARLHVAARVAPVALPRHDVAVAEAARAGVARVVGVVQVEERHHAAVLCAPQRVELQVLRLTQVEIARARVKNVADLEAVAVRELRGHRRARRLFKVCQRDLLRQPRGGAPRRLARVAVGAHGKVPRYLGALRGALVDVDAVELLRAWQLALRLVQHPRRLQPRHA